MGNFEMKYLVLIGGELLTEDKPCVYCGYPARYRIGREYLCCKCLEERESKVVEGRRDKDGVLVLPKEEDWE